MYLSEWSKQLDFFQVSLQLKSALNLQARLKGTRHLTIRETSRQHGRIQPELSRMNMKSGIQMMIAYTTSQLCITFPRLI